MSLVVDLVVLHRLFDLAYTTLLGKWLTINKLGTIMQPILDLPWMKSTWKLFFVVFEKKKFFLVTMQLSNYEKWDDQIKKDIRIYWNNSNGSRCKYFSKTINKVLFQYGCRENIWNSRLLPMIAASTKRLSRLQTIMLTPRGVGWYLWRGPPRGGWGAIGGGGTLRW